MNKGAMNKKIAVLLLVGTFSSLVFAGGPWTPKKGKSYYKLSEWGMLFDQHYTNSGQLDPNLTTGVFNTFIYGEYGITDRLVAVVSAAVFSRNYYNNLVSKTTGETLIKGEAVNSFGDIDLIVKYSLTKQGAKYPIAVSGLLGLPSGKVGAGSEGNLQTGDGEFNQAIQIDVGHGFKIAKKIPAYYAFYAGFNNRTKNYSEEIRFGGEFGLAFFKQKLWLINRLTAIESLKNGATAEMVTSTSIFANNTEFIAFSIEANQYLSKKWGISVSFASALRGEIIAAAPSYSFGVFYDLTK